MSLGTLIFSGSSWLWLDICLLAAALLSLFWSYRSSPSGPLRWICVPLKLLGFCALAFCLLEPLWSGQKARPGANLFAILADNSQGLQIKARGATETRADFLRHLLATSPWQGALEENFDLRRYLFDSRLQSTTDFSEFAADGRASAIGSSLRSLAERYRGRPLA